MNALTIALQAQQQGGGMSFIIMMVAIFAIMWFFMIRPQQKKQKELQNFQNTIYWHRGSHPGRHLWHSKKD